MSNFRERVAKRVP